MTVLVYWYMLLVKLRPLAHYTWLIIIEKPNGRMYLLHEMRINCPFKTELFVMIICIFNLMLIPWKRWRRQKGWRHANMLLASVEVLSVYAQPSGRHTRWREFAFVPSAAAFFLSPYPRASLSQRLSRNSLNFFKQKETIRTHLLMTSIKIITFYYYYYYHY